MKQALALIALVFFLSSARSQPASRPERTFTVSIEPNLLLAGRSYTREQPRPLYLKETPAMGAGVNFGYQLEAKQWYAGGVLQVADLRNTVVVDYAGSGFASQYRFVPASNRYSFGYGPIIGLEAQGGYRKQIGRSTLLVGGGLHLHLYPRRIPARGVRLDPQETNGAGFLFVYYEDADHYPLVAPGADLHLQYALRIGSQRPFIGLHYSYSMSTVEGSYGLFPGESFRNGGHFTVRQSFVGLQLGLMLGR